MPKEVIHDNTPLKGTDNSTPYAVEVGWARDAYVQLGSVNLQAEDSASIEGNGIHRGWFVDLDRLMVNRLIRVLRRARDQAFGADE